jgi:hypothetical protein
MHTRLDLAGERAEERFRRFFLVAALYDGVLGVAFFLLYKPLFDWLNITRPENSSYVLLSAAFVAVQGLGYAFVARNLRRNVDLVRVGVAYKVVYSGLSFYYLATGQLVHPVFALFGACDVVFLIGFIAFLWKLQPASAETATGGTPRGESTV